MSTYKIIDCQTDEVVATSFALDDLRVFANDLFWNDDDIDFCNSDFVILQEAILGCDYYVEEE